MSNQSHPEGQKRIGRTAGDAVDQQLSDTLHAWGSSRQRRGHRNHDGRSQFSEVHLIELATKDSTAYTPPSTRAKPIGGHWRCFMAVSLGVRSRLWGEAEPLCHILEPWVFGIEPLQLSTGLRLLARAFVHQGPLVADIP